jgi:hypothetical protein
MLKDNGIEKYGVKIENVALRLFLKKGQIKYQIGMTPLNEQNNSYYIEANAHEDMEGFISDKFKESVNSKLKTILEYLNNILNIKDAK